MIWHNATATEVLTELSVDDKRGLTNGVAEERLEIYGQNVVTNIEKKTLLKRFLGQINNTLTIALIIISIISYVLCLVKNVENAYFSLLIIAIVLLNALISAYVTMRSDNNLSNIQNMSNPTVSVLREGILKNLNAAMLVPGDIIILEAGDYIPADARIIECNELRVNEYNLTGIEVPSEKHADILFDDITPIESRANMIWAGTSVVHGEAKAVVTETNFDTEIARTNTILSQTSDVRLPFQNQLDNMGKIVNYVIFGICAVIFIISFIINFKTDNFANMTVQMLLNSIALAVAAIPEGLSVIATVVISTGFARILKSKIIIKEPSAAEKLSNIEVLCCDKTGVFTHNKMVLSGIYCGHSIKDVNSGALDEAELTVIKLATACSTLENDYTEAAIEKACLAYNSMSKIDINNIFPHVAEIPFDKDRKTMSVMTLINERPVAIIKGAVESVVPKCVGVDTDALFEINNKFTSDALRVVCIAIKPLDLIPTNPIAEEIENNLTFAGMLAFEDPLRSTVINDVAFINKANIKLVMITGDNLLTAKSVARRIGILKDGSYAITGDELRQVTDEELAENIDKITVFARVNSIDKYRIVKAFKAKNYSIAVTGDGIEDAEALGIADVGCAIGKFGVDVTMGNSDIIIKNNRFETIVKAIKECRGIFNNIRKSIFYLFSCNFAEILTVLFGLIFFGVMPVNALQLLWINLLTDSAPALALSMDSPYEKDVKRNYASGINKIFNMKTFIYVIIHSVIISAVSLLAFYIGGNTMAFVTLTLIQLFHCFNSKFSGSLINGELFKNDFMNVSAIVIFAVTILLSLTPIGSVFGLASLRIGKFAISLLMAFAIVPICEILKRLIKY